MTSRDPLTNLFAKKFDKPSDLLCCAFGLRDSEIDTYFALMSGEKTVEEIAEMIERDRTTVQRVLKKLHKKNLVKRKRETFDRGGYYYLYEAISTETVRTRILEQLDEWYSKTRKFLLAQWPDRSD
jgi:predicted transcriptional regulator